MSPLELLGRCTQPGTVRRAATVALVVGTVLNLINHFPVLAGAPAGPVEILQMALTYLVPYLVSTHGQVAGRRAAQREPARRPDCA